MNSEEITKFMDETLEKLTERLDKLKEEAAELRQQAQDLDQLAIEEKEKVEQMVGIFGVFSEYVSATKSLEEMCQSAVSKSDVGEILDDLETSATPDFKSARTKLGIEETGAEAKAALQEAS